MREQMARVAVKLQRAPVLPAVMPSSYAVSMEPDVPFAPASGLPGELIDTVTLSGPVEVVRERLGVFRAAGVGTLIVSLFAGDPAERMRQLRLVAELAAEA